MAANQHSSSFAQSLVTALDIRGGSPHKRIDKPHPCRYKPSESGPPRSCWRICGSKVGES